jgi:DMSO/TMAO reductase YedYZ molybdopterin-dependent catalytic subunit
MAPSTTGRRTNLALGVLLAVTTVTGVLMFAIGTGWNEWSTVAHGVAGTAVVALLPWKSTISRRGIARRGWRAAIPSLALALAVVVALVTGFAHRAGVRHLGPLLVQQVHVGAAIATIPLALRHALSRPVRVRGVDLDRRATLRAGLLLTSSAVATIAVPHAGARPTRSLEVGSLDPSSMPVTQWLDDDVPHVDAERWRLTVGDRVWSRAELDRLVDDQGVEIAAVLDCTGGWFAEQRWRGIPLADLLIASGAIVRRSVDVRSSTGYWRRLPARDIGTLLVATRVGGEPLSPGHGAPARLVAPGRRGFWWVKWVETIETSDEPWWWQVPFPLT